MIAAFTWWQIPLVVIAVIVAIYGVMFLVGLYRSDGSGGNG